METNTRASMTFPDALKHFFGAPFRLRTYTNLLYLMLAFPMGLIYFIFLIVGLSLGLGLTILWVGVPILALVFAGSWGLAAMERQLAIHALGAEVPPMTQTLPPPVSAAQTFWQRAGAFFSNPVTWKGMAFLLVKLPLGVVSFFALVSLLATSAALILTPIAWQWGDLLYVDDMVWTMDTWVSPWFAGLLGVGLLFLSLNLLNGLALVWRWTATSLLGSERFAAAAPPPEMPEAVALA